MDWTEDDEIEALVEDDWINRKHLEYFLEKEWVRRQEYFEDLLEKEWNERKKYETYLEVLDLKLVRLLRSLRHDHDIIVPECDSDILSHTSSKRMNQEEFYNSTDSEDEREVQDDSESEDEYYEATEIPEEPDVAHSVNSTVLIMPPERTGPADLSTIVASGISDDSEDSDASPEETDTRATEETGQGTELENTGWPWLIKIDHVENLNCIPPFENSQTRSECPSRILGLGVDDIDALSWNEMDDPAQRQNSLAKSREKVQTWLENLKVLPEALENTRRPSGTDRSSSEQPEKDLQNISANSDRARRSTVGSQESETNGNRNLESSNQKKTGLNHRSKSRSGRSKSHRSKSRGHRSKSGSHHRRTNTESSRMGQPSERSDTRRMTEKEPTSERSESRRITDKEPRSERSESRRITDKEPRSERSESRRITDKEPRSERSESRRRSNKERTHRNGSRRRDKESSQRSDIRRSNRESGNRSNNRCSANPETNRRSRDGSQNRNRTVTGDSRNNNREIRTPVSDRYLRSEVGTTVSDRQQRSERATNGDSRRSTNVTTYTPASNRQTEATINVRPSTTNPRKRVSSTNSSLLSSPKRPRTTETIVSTPRHSTHVGHCSGTRQVDKRPCRITARRQCDLCYQFLCKTHQDVKISCPRFSNATNECDWGDDDDDAFENGRYQGSRKYQIKKCVSCEKDGMRRVSRTHCHNCYKYICAQHQRKRIRCEGCKELPSCTQEELTPPLGSSIYSAGASSPHSHRGIIDSLG